MAKRIHKDIGSLPWVCHPARDPSVPWVPEHRQPNEWLKLFFGESLNGDANGRPSSGSGALRVRRLAQPQLAG